MDWKRLYKNEPGYSILMEVWHSKDSPVVIPKPEGKCINYMMED